MLATSIKMLAKQGTFKGTNRTQIVAVLERAIRADWRLIPKASYFLLYTSVRLMISSCIMLAMNLWSDELSVSLKFESSVCM